MVAIGSDHGVLALSDKCWLKSFNNSQLKELSVTKDAFTALILESTHGGDKNDYPSDGLRPEPRSFTGQ